MSELGRKYRSLGMPEHRKPREQILQEEAVRSVISKTRQIDPKAAQPFRTPIDLQYTVGTTLPQRLPRAARVVLLAVLLSTPPTTGVATIQVTARTALSGTEDLGVVRVSIGQAFAELALNSPQPAGAWIGVTTLVPNGASGIAAAITATIEEG